MGLFGTILGALAVAAACLAAFASCGRESRALAKPRKGAFRSVNTSFVTYSYPLPQPSELTAYVLADGSSELETTGEPVSLVEQHHGEIGLYRHGLGEDVGRKLRPLAEAAIAERPPGEVAVRPGTPLLAFGVGENQKVDRVVSFPLASLPPATAHFQREMVVVVRELLRHPVRTVRGSATWATASAAPSGPLTLVVRVQSSGQERVEIHNPAAVKRGEPCGLRLDLVADKPWNQLGPADRASLELTGGEVRDVRGSPQSPVAALDPGKVLELEATVQRHSFLSPGRYRAVLRFHSTSKKARADAAVPGILEIVPPPLVVQPPGR